MSIVFVFTLVYFGLLLLGPFLLMGFWLLATFLKVGWRYGKQLYDSYS